MIDASTLRADLERQGFRLSLVAAGLQVEPASRLTPDARATIRANKSALSELMQAEAEIRALLARQCPEDHPDYPEALAIALRDPGAALEALRVPAESWSADKRAELRAMARGVE